MRRLILVVAVAGVLAGASPGHSAADDGGAGGGHSTSTGAVVTASTSSGGRPGGGGGSGSGGSGVSPWEACESLPASELTPGASTVTREQLGPNLAPYSPWAEGQTALVPTLSAADVAAASGWTWCVPRDGGGQVQWVDVNGVPVDPTPLLVAQARSELVVPLPDASMSPPLGGAMPVGLPVWFWVENFAASSATASVPGVSVTAQAEPVSTRLVVSAPNGSGGAKRSEVSCGGAGERYVAGGNDPWAGSSCSWAFRWGGDATVTVVVRWRLSWTSSTGGSGDLGTIDRERPYVLHPTEFEAVTD